MVLTSAVPHCVQEPHVADAAVEGCVGLLHLFVQGFCSDKRWRGVSVAHTIASNIEIMCIFFEFRLCAPIRPHTRSVAIIMCCGFHALSLKSTFAGSVGQASSCENNRFTWSLLQQPMCVSVCRYARFYLARLRLLSSALQDGREYLCEYLEVNRTHTHR